MRPPGLISMRSIRPCTPGKTASRRNGTGMGRESETGARSSLDSMNGKDRSVKGASPMGKTMFQKIWDAHVVHEQEGITILYIDRHLVHEVTSPQAFEGLRLTGRKVRRPESTFATMDHNIPTTGRGLPIRDALSKKQ